MQIFILIEADTEDAWFSKHQNITTEIKLKGQERIQKCKRKQGFTNCITIYSRLKVPVSVFNNEAFLHPYKFYILTFFSVSAENFNIPCFYNLFHIFSKKYTQRFDQFLKLISWFVQKLKRLFHRRLLYSPEDKLYNWVIIL
jgi:hypothetical protein